MKTNPLVIIGLDAATPALLVRWAREGYLPNVARLLRRGCWGETAGPELKCEHGVWISLLSGVSRACTGYYYFRQLAPGTYDLRPVNGSALGVRPFWAALAGTGRRVAIFDAPDCHPVRGVEGIQLANWAGHLGWATRDPAYAPKAEPPSLLEAAARAYGPREILIENADAGHEENRRTRRRLLAQIGKKGEMCRRLMADAGGRFDLVAIVFSEAHAASHQFWQYHTESLNGREDGAGELTHAVRDVYAAIDGEVGRLLDVLPRDANVFLLSSVGVETDHPTTELIESFCRALGYQAAPGGAPPSLSPLTLARRALPETLRVRLSRMLPRDTRERLLADKFRGGTDWPRTRAFAVPSFYTSFIRVNLRGREPQGVVSPGAEYAGLLGEIETDLRLLRDAETGEPAVVKVTRAVDAFGLDAPPASLPDLFVEWKHDRFMSSVTHPKAELRQARPEFFRPSDHSARGFWAAAGPSVVARGRAADVSPLDLAPTFVRLLGLNPAPEMMGHVMSVIAESEHGGRSLTDDPAE